MVGHVSPRALGEGTVVAKGRLTAFHHHAPSRLPCSVCPATTGLLDQDGHHGPCQGLFFLVASADRIVESHEFLLDDASCLYRKKTWNSGSA